MIRLSLTAVALLILTVPLGAQARDWRLDSQASFINFGSIKAGSIGENHRFQSFEGHVDESGEADIAIDLISVATGIDIRNERMRKFLFQTDIFPKAKLTGQVPLAELEGLAIGASKTVNLALTLSLHGEQAPVEFPALVTRLGESEAEVIPAELIFVDPSRFELEGGIAKLQELAGLDSITRAVPVSFRLLFNQSAS